MTENTMTENDLNAAKEVRLLSLLRRRYADSPKFMAEIEPWEPGMGTGDHAAGFKTLRLCAALLIARAQLRGMTWDDLHGAITTGQTPVQFRPVISRIARAATLLDRVVTSGCLKQAD